MTPTVSVVIPTYNRANLLERAIRSVLFQTYRDFEIIVVDDASTDNTQEMLKERFKQEIDSGILGVIRNETNMERSRSRNKGIEMARGEYIALLDDDDIWLPDHLSVLTNFFNKIPYLGAVFSNAINYSPDNNFAEPIRKNFIPTGFGMHYRYLSIGGHLVFLPAALIKKTIFENIGGIRMNLVFAEDWEFSSRVAMNYDIGYINYITCVRLIHIGSYRGDQQEQSSALEKALEVIEDNARKYNFYIPNSIIVPKYLDIARSFIPHDFHKLRLYLFKALKEKPSCVIDKKVFSLIIKAIMGKRFYLFIKYFRVQFK